MARIRSIKPEFWTSAQVMECSPIARLLFIGLWNFADDHGRMPANPKTIKAQVFPGDEIAISEVSRMIDELSANGLIQTYVVDRKDYLSVTGWHHQKIDKPQKPKYPGPPDDYSPNDRRTFATDLTDPRGREKEGKGSSVPNGTGAHAPPQPSKSTDPKVAFYGRTKKLLGPKSGGLATDLLKAHDGDPVAATRAVAKAEEAADPREYICAIIQARTRDADLIDRGQAW